MTPIAQAYYQTPYHGRVLVSLMPFRTTRHGTRVWRYRWVDNARGFALPYNPAARPQMHVTLALLSPLFDSVACTVEGREHFIQTVDAS